MTGTPEGLPLAVACKSCRHFSGGPNSNAWHKCLHPLQEKWTRPATSWEREMRWNPDVHSRHWCIFHQPRTT